MSDGKTWKEPPEVKTAMEALESAEKVMRKLALLSPAKIVDIDDAIHAAITELQQATFRRCADIVRDYRRALN